MKHRPYQAGISAAHPLAVEAGMDVLRSGGNAVDAAIAVAYMLGVVEPYASGIGGGGVMLVSPPSGKDSVLYGYREVAPMSGVVSKYETGVPGFVKGMETVHSDFGSIELHRLIQPAVAAAEHGFPAGKALSRQMNNTLHLEKERFPQFFPEGRPVREGEHVKQPLLAETMRSLQQEGAKWFYEGEAACTICELIEGMDKQDLQRYEVSVSEPVYSSFGGFEMLVAPPPFGGLTLIQALKLGEALRLHETEETTVLYYHLWGETMGKCYSLRNTTMADPSYCEVPVESLLDEEMISQLASQIRFDAVSQEMSAGDVANTTHFVVVDTEGMCVSTTNTIGGFFSSGLSVGGYFLNNQLRNFTADQQSPNTVEPGKTPQSYVSPTILRNPQQTIAIGSAGGKRIPMTLAGILTKMTKHHIGIEEAVSAERFFIDNKVMDSETPVPAEVKLELEKLGYTVNYNPDPMFYGGVHGLSVNHATGEVFGAADPRRGGTWKKEWRKFHER